MSPVIIIYVGNLVFHFVSLSCAHTHTHIFFLFSILWLHARQWVFTVQCVYTYIIAKDMNRVIAICIHFVHSLDCFKQISLCDTLYTLMLMLPFHIATRVMVCMRFVWVVVFFFLLSISCMLMFVWPKEKKERKKKKKVSSYFECVSWEIIELT